MERKQVKNLGKGMIIAILIVLAILIFIVARRVIIIKNLQEKISHYTNLTNYYEKVCQYQGDNLSVVFETYMKDGKYVTIMEAKNGEKDKRIINYSDGQTINTYIENGEEKYAWLNSNGLPSPATVSNWLYTENIFQCILGAMQASIKEVEYNGRECYKIDNFHSTSSMYIDGNLSVYIDKETGLPLKVINGTATIDGKTYDLINEYIYEFNSITDSDLIEPDINQYIIKEN